VGFRDTTQNKALRIAQLEA
jgi:hypothetical protein